MESIHVLPNISEGGDHHINIPNSAYNIQCFCLEGAGESLDIAQALVGHNQGADEL